MDVARTAVMMVLSIVVPLLVQRWDKRRLDEQQRSRGWNFASWACALYAFGPLSMLGWVFVTRPRWRRCLVAPLFTTPIVLLLALVDGAFAWAADGGADVESGELLLVVPAVALGTMVVMVIVETIAIVWSLIKIVSSLIKRVPTRFKRA